MSLNVGRITDLFAKRELLPVVTNELKRREDEQHRKWLFGIPPYTNDWMSSSFKTSLWADLLKLRHRVTELSNRLDKLEGKEDKPYVSDEHIRIYIQKWVDEHKE